MSPHTLFVSNRPVTVLTVEPGDGTRYTVLVQTRDSLCSTMLVGIGAGESPVCATIPSWMLDTLHDTISDLLAAPPDAYRTGELPAYTFRDCVVNMTNGLLTYWESHLPAGTAWHNHWTAFVGFWTAMCVIRCSRADWGASIAIAGLCYHGKIDEAATAWAAIRT